MYLSPIFALLMTLAHASRITETYINYTTVTGYFLQDDPSTNATTFDFTTTNFGLINRTYPCDSPTHGNHLTQWQRFERQVSQLNHHAPRGVEYKVLYLGRHGNGYHNAAETYYGTPAWNCYYSLLDGNATVTWADAQLTPLGVDQALVAHRFWTLEIETQKIPTPQTYYTSPLTRCLQTANLTFRGLSLPRKYPFVPEVKEFFREGISGHTCDRRQSKTYIRNTFPSYRIEPGFTETDQLWEALHAETSTDQDIRSKKVLDDVFSSDDSTYLSITSHSGEIASLLRVLGHREFRLSTGAVIPVLVRAQTLRGEAPTTASQPYSPICTSLIGDVTMRRADRGVSRLNRRFGFAIATIIRAYSTCRVGAFLARPEAPCHSPPWTMRPLLPRPHLQPHVFLRFKRPIAQPRFLSSSSPGSNEATGVIQDPCDPVYPGTKKLDLTQAQAPEKVPLFLDTFPPRHIGPSPQDAEVMLAKLDPPCNSLPEFIEQVLPPDILTTQKLELHGSKAHGESHSETALLVMLKHIANGNKRMRSFIGCGYAGTKVPEVIKRNVLQNPGWYTSYTPYQPEISQGRLESLLNFQTMVSDLTGLSISNASVLDEPTAAAEAMTLSLNALSSSRQKSPNKTFLVSDLCHPQTIAVLQSRADGFGIKIATADLLANSAQAVTDVGDDLIGVLAQYPDTEGGIVNFRTIADRVHSLGATFCVGTDLLALTLLKPPGEFGADIAFGNAQRFGVPFGFGGPHAAFFACSEKYKRKIPGRLVGVSKDRLGNKALRLALQTREQHIRREKATSNICTAQALLANMSAFYAIYHGPGGLCRIAENARMMTYALRNSLLRLGYVTGGRGGRDALLFDTLTVNVGSNNAAKIAHWAAEKRTMNFRILDDHRLGITLDETISEKGLRDMISVFRHFAPSPADSKYLSSKLPSIPAELKRTSPFLTHPVFNTHHSETELMRYIHHLQSKDLSLVHSMIPLGSCTMKLNSATEMASLTWPEFSDIHPFVPIDQAHGYMELIGSLEKDLARITGFDAVSLQPNSGAQGEFTGLRVIRKYQEEQPGRKRDICLIPVSAHGTNPASAAMAGMRVVTIKCESSTGNLDMKDLKDKCEKYSEELGAIMITYPSTFGVFEPKIKAACEMVHEHGGQVYMDGANLNAMIGLCSPGEIGADVCHLNLHKTFCIPHGGGGPGVGPIGVKSHLAPYLPGHPFAKVGGEKGISPVSGAPWGSASILPISWAYIKMMGGKGLTDATRYTLLNANYILARLKPHYPILYTNAAGRCAHEFILDVRKFKETAGIEAIDVAKRLQDYGFHAPTMSWPVANTLMIEPTESESLAEMDRFCDALIEIRKEIAAIENGEQPREGNVMKMAPHSMRDLLEGDQWERSYSRATAAYPLPWLKEKKFWPSVTRLDDAYGDMNLFCSCGPVETIDGLTGAAAPAAT